MKTILLVPIAALVVTVAAREAEAKQVHFAGPHPVAAEYGGGYCYIEGPHIHIYEPANADVLYRQHDDNYVFVGDPVAHGYEGPKHAYYGPHPIPVAEIVGEATPETQYCYIEGPHYHIYAPPPELKFAVKGGVYFFTGELPQVYVQEKPKYVRINTVYEPVHYARPVFVEAPPPEYHGPVVAVQPATVVVHDHTEPTAVVVPGGVSAGAEVVAAPAPGVEFHAGISVGVPGVVVAAPPPPVVVVRPAPMVVVQPAPAVIIEGKEHHDNGKHKGWDHH